MQMRLLLVDSVAFPFRMHPMEWRHKVVVLASLAAALRRIAARGVAVLTVNQVTGYSSAAYDDVQPALGARSALLVRNAYNLSISLPSGGIIEHAQRRPRLLGVHYELSDDSTAANSSRDTRNSA